MRTHFALSLLTLVACDSDDTTGGISRAEFMETVQALQADLDEANAVIAALEADLTQLQQQANANTQDLNGFQNNVDDAATAAAENADTLADLAERVAIIEGDYLTSADSSSLPTALAAFNNYLSVNTSDHSITFSGANLFVDNGTGSTESVNGLGNVVIGYGENSGVEDQSGSHNLTLGTYNSWPSYGAIVSGVSNRATAHAAAIGGVHNEVDGPYGAAIAGYYVSVSGSASGSVGGYNNDLSGSYAAAIAGQTSSITGSYSAVLGGSYGSTSASYTAVIGGYDNSAAYSYAAVLGGYGNTADGSYSTAVGGYDNNASSSIAAVFGGDGNVASGSYAVILGGNGNVASSSYAAVFGGYGNVASNTYAATIGGYGNDATGTGTLQLGGLYESCATSYGVCTD